MYLLKLLSKYKAISIWIATSLLAIGGGIWNFDFQKLFPHTTLDTETIWRVRMGLTLILPSAFLISLIAILLHDHKRIMMENTDLRNKIENINQKLDEHSQELAWLKRKTSGIIPPPIKGIAD
jgi:hypothetical protein